MYITRVSNSKLESFKECPWKYYCKYHEYLPEERDDTALQFGSYIHRILERGVAEYTLSGLEVISEEEKANYKFSKDYLPKIIKCLKNFLDFNTKIAKSKTVGVELREEFEISKDIVYNGIIDRVIQAEDGSIMVIDYKTSKSEKTRIELGMDNQLLGYAVMCSKKYDIPLNKITCAHFYPITGNFVSVTYPTAKTAYFINEIKEQVWKIRKKTKEQFLPIKNKFCNWCQFKRACPLFVDNFTVQKIIQENHENQLSKKKQKEEGLPGVQKG